MTEAPEPGARRLAWPLRGYVRAVDRVSTLVGLVTMYLVFVMMGVLLYDAVTRNLVGVPIHWGIEFTQFVLTAYYFSGGAYSLKEGAHVRMDLIYDRLSERGRAGMDLVTGFALLFFLCVLLWGSISSALYSIEYKQTLFSIWSPSVVPIKLLMIAALVLFILQAIATLIKDYAVLRRASLL